MLQYGMKAAIRFPRQLADRVERLRRLDLPVIIELHTFGEELRHRPEFTVCVEAAMRLRERHHARLFVHVPYQQPEVVTKLQFDREQVLRAIELAEAIDAEGIILHRYWALAVAGEWAGIPKNEAEAAFNEEMRRLSRELGHRDGWVENLGFFWLRPRGAGRYLAGPLDHFLPWEVKRFTNFLDREGIINIRPMLDIAHAAVSANMFTLLRKHLSRLRTDPRFQGITAEDLSQRAALTPYDFLQYSPRYLHLSDALFLGDPTRLTDAAMAEMLTSESMPVGAGNLDFRRVITHLVLQQRLVISGPAGVMRLAGAGLAVASPV